MERPRTDILTGLYSQLCGILAGFTFAGLSVYLTQTTLPAQANAVATALFCSFAALVLMAILYTLLSGDSENPRSISGLFVYGLPLGLSIAATFYAVALMARGRAELGSAVLLGKVLVSVVVPVVVLARLGVAASFLGRDRSRLRPHHVAFVLAGLELAVSLTVFIVPAVADLHLVVSDAVPALMALIAAIASLTGSTVLSTRARDFVLPDALQYVHVVVSFGVLTVFSFLSFVSLSR